MTLQRQLVLPDLPSGLRARTSRWNVLARAPAPSQWVKVDDGLHDHPKFQRLSSPAFRLWFKASCWASANLTDGFLPQSEASGFAFARALADGVAWKDLVRELVEARLWDPVEGGWQIHDFLKYQPAREEVVDAREKTRERVAAWRARTRSVTNGVSNSVTPPPCNAVRTGAPSPSPSPSPSPVPSAAAAARARDDGERETFGRIVWDTYRSRLPRARQPSPRELAVVERWYVAGVDADFVAGLINEEEKATRTLLWFADRVMEAWEGHQLQTLREELLSRLERLYGRLAPDAALDLAERVEGADSSDALRDVEAKIADAEGQS